jgi:hypothetical protein
VIVYGVADAGIDEVWNVVEKPPVVPTIAVVTVEPSMVIEMGSPAGG